MTVQPEKIPGKQSVGFRFAHPETELLHVRIPDIDGLTCAVEPGCYVLLKAGHDVKTTTLELRKADKEGNSPRNNRKTHCCQQR